MSDEKKPADGADGPDERPGSERGSASGPKGASIFDFLAATAAAGGPPKGPRTPASGGKRGKPGPLGLTVAVVVVLSVLIGWGAQIWTEYLWFDSVNFTQVWWTQLWAQAGLAITTGLLTALVVSASLIVAYRSRPLYPPLTVQQQVLDRYRQMLEPVRSLVMIGVPLALAFFVGAASSAQWKTALLWLNRKDFGYTDPTFKYDIGFFVFTLPWLRFVESLATLVLGLALIGAALLHYIYGGIHTVGRKVTTTAAARIHLSVLAALLVLVQALGYWLDTFELAVKDSSRITGLTYTDYHAVLPTKMILAVAAVICAALFLSTIWTQSWRLPMVGVALLVVTSLVVGGMYPEAVRRFKVQPSEQALEEPFIQHNIDATRKAYGLDSIKVQDYVANFDTDRGKLAREAASVPGIRIVDPYIVSPTFRQMQAAKQYHTMPESLDVDRYQIGGKSQDVVVAAREVDVEGIPPNQRNWVNDHQIYTHGYGIVAAAGNQRDPNGSPAYIVKDMPVQAPKELQGFEPRIYFGEKSPEYSVVGGSPGSEPREIDYPRDMIEGDTQSEQRTTYTGKGGVALHNFARRAAYAITQQEPKLLLSEQVGDYSRLLDHRQPRERVERVAPWLTLDGNIYPTIIDKRVKWVVDGYTTSSSYPYSKLQQLNEVVSDSTTERVRNFRKAQGVVNYLRNSVKATVDAYDGTVELYAWDDQDPLLKAWSSAFSNSVKPLSEMTGQLMSHVRYPEDMFKVQRDLWERYHVADPNGFFNSGDFWTVPRDPTVPATPGDQGKNQPPYYLSIAMPGEKNPRFSLTTSFSPSGGRPVLAGFMAADSDAGSTPGKKAPTYGQLRLLRLTTQANVPGPSQVQNQINASSDTSRDFAVTLAQYLNLNQAGSSVQRGNLLTLPFGGGLLYVQPIYVKGAGGSSYPLMQAVVTGFGDKLAWGRDLNSALEQLFGAASGSTPQVATPGQPGTAPAPPQGTQAQQLAQVLQQIQQHYKASQDALKAGNWTLYGQEQQKLGAAVEQALKLQPAGGATTVGGASPTAVPPAAPAGAPQPAPAPGGAVTPAVPAVTSTRPGG